MSVTTPKDSPFGQEDFFNIIAYRNETANILYSKLSVKTSVSFFATLFYKWISLPQFGSQSVLEQDTTTSSSRFPVSIFALTLSFLLFIITFISFRKFEYNVAGFFLGIVLSTISYVLLVIII